MQTIVTLTMNPTIDKSAAVSRVAAGRKLRCELPRHEPGGGGVNVSRAIGRLGGESLALYPAGGALGQMLERLLDQEKVPHSPVSIQGMTRENLTIFDQSTDEQFRFGMPGPTLTEEEWQACLDELVELDPRPDYVVGSGSLPPGTPEDFYARVARRVREMGGRAIVDTSEGPLQAAAEEGVYLLKPNMRELGQLAGREIEGEADQEAVARDIVESGKAEVVVVSLGAAGVLLATGKEMERLRAPTVSIESKIGAGDSMVAGIALALARGKALRDAVRFGVAAGSAAVMTPGTELCRREDTERLYEQMTSRDE